MESVCKTGMLASKQFFKIVSVDITSIDTMHNVPDVFTSQSFGLFAISM